MDQAVQGSGPGPAIVRTIVTEHGGAVTVRSASGRGEHLPQRPAGRRRRRRRTDPAEAAAEPVPAEAAAEPVPAPVPVPEPARGSGTDARRGGLSRPRAPAVP